MENIEVLFSDNPEITHKEEGAYFVTYFGDQNEPWTYKLPYDMGYQIGMHIGSRMPPEFLISNHQIGTIKFKHDAFDSNNKINIKRGLSASELNELYLGIKEALECKESREDDFNPGSTPSSGGDMHPT